MIGVLRHQHLRHQSGGGNAFVDDVRRNRRLYELLAPAACPLAAHMPLHGEHARHVVELLRNVFTDAMHLTAAGAHCAGRLVPQLTPRQIGGQRLAFRLTRLAHLRARQCFEFVAHRLRICIERFLERLALLGTEALRLRSKLQALEHGVLVRELLDQRALVAQLRLQPHGLGVQLLVREFVQSRCRFDQDARSLPAVTRATHRWLRQLRAGVKSLQHRDHASLAHALTRQSEHQGVELCACHTDTWSAITRPGEATLVQPPRGQPHADAVMHEHLQASGAGIGKEIRVVRPGRTEHRDDPRERSFGACAHVQRFHGQPDGLDSDHLSSSRIQAAHCAAAVPGHVTAIRVAPRCSSMRMSAGAAASTAAGSASGMKAATGAGSIWVDACRRHLCTTFALIPCARATLATEASGCAHSARTCAFSSLLYRLRGRER